MLNTLKAILDHRGAYAKKIRFRHKQFWSDPNAESVRNTKMSADDGIEKWKNVRHWQRKLSNKHNAREFAVKFGCKVAKLYWEGRDVENIDFTLLPENYVIRPTIGHSSNNVFIMKNSFNLFDKKHYKEEDILASLKHQVAVNANVSFLIEEFLTNEDCKIDILKDYKLFCFNGEIACIWVIDRLSPTSGTSCFYDINWNMIRAVNTKYKQTNYQAPPACLPEMLEKAKTLSKAYGIFVRIDFYATDRGAVFGEFTPTPSMGGSTTSFGKKLLINYWNSYCRDLI